MPDHDRLSSLVLKHWSLYRPSMLDQLRREGRLEATLEQTAQQMSDLLYELVSVKQMQYHQAWEIAIRQVLPPEEPSSTSNPNPNPGPRATSA
jgi:hypothetical protein